MGGVWGSTKFFAAFLGTCGTLICVSGCGTSAQSIMQVAGSVIQPHPAIATTGQTTGQITATAQSHGVWPVDTALVPPPTVFLATDANCESDAALPVSPALNVVADASGNNHFKVNVSETDRIGATQQGPTLCWAACTQTLLRQQGAEVNQAALANEFVPDTGDADQTAGLGVVTRALNPDLEPQVEQRGAIPITLVSITSDQMLNELMSGHLCIVGLVENREDNIGHACVVCGATFARLKPSALGMLNMTIAVNPSVRSQDNDALKSNLNPAFGLYEVELFDPEPNVGLRKLTAQQFCDQAVFITSHKIARDLLMSALEAPPVLYPNPNQVVVKSKTYIRKEKLARARAGRQKPPAPANTAQKPKIPVKKKPEDSN